MRKRFTGFMALLLIALLLTGCGKASPPAYAPTAAPQPAAATPSPSPASLIKDMVVYYGQYGDEAEGHVDALLGQLRDAAGNLVNSAAEAVDWAKTVLNHFIEAVAVLIVTDCVIPVLVVLLFARLVKYFFAATRDMPI